MLQKYKLKAVKGDTTKILAFESMTAVQKAMDEYLLLGYKVTVIGERCKHSRMNSSSGGWSCPDCKRQWNSKGNLVKGEK